MWTFLFLLLLAIAVACFQYRKSRNEWIVADKRGSKAKVAAKKQIYKDSILSAFVIGAISIFIIGGQWLDKRERAQADAIRDARDKEALENSRLILRRSVMDTLRVSEEDLKARYKLGFVVFSATTNISYLEYSSDPGITIDESTVEVRLPNPDYAEIRIPYYNVVRNGVTNIQNETTELWTIKRKPGQSVGAGIQFNVINDQGDKVSTRPWIEILKTSPHGIVWALGFGRTQQVEKSPTVPTVTTAP
jgi:hypothetical protein